MMPNGIGSELKAVERDAVGPEGQDGVLIDNVMVLRRR
jgi:hypothetical protein